MKHLALAALLLFAATPAFAQCEAPPPVAAYLKAHPGWRVLTLADLTKDQQAQWNDAHKAFCPGVAEVAVDPGSQKSYAIALLNKDGSQEEILLLHGGSAIVLEPASQSTGMVVWRAAPGKYDDPATGRKTAIATDSVMVELFESAAEQFYLAKGRLKRLQAGD